MISGVDPSALRAARERAGLTQHQLARLIGAAGGERVSRWELGTSTPRPHFVDKLARVLLVAPDDLVGYDGEVPDLRALRFRAGLSVDQLVDRAKVARSTYLRWESGDWVRLPAPAALASLASSLKESKSTVVAAFEEAQRLRAQRRGA